MIITLLSDFGYQDNFVAVAKGILLQHLPHAHLIDLNHSVEPFHLQQCSYLLKSAYLYFPAQTVHLSLFDIMRQVPASLLIAKVEEQYIISADNGLLPLTFEGNLDLVYGDTAMATSYHDWLSMAALFIRRLELSGFQMDDLKPVVPAVAPVLQKVLIKQGAIECQVMYIDRYENVVVNLTKEEFEQHRKGRGFRLSFVRDQISQISQYYTDVPVGEKLCLFNSSGFLEIAINQGKASSLLGLRLHNGRQLIYTNIKIEFL